MADQKRIIVVLSIMRTLRKPLNVKKHAGAKGRGSPRVLGRDGTPLPCARCISLQMARDVHQEYPMFTHMLMQWGQFMNHDLTNKPVWTDVGGSEIECCGPRAMENPECFPISIPEDDLFYSHYRKRCMNFVRSKPYPGRDYISNFREQYNENTAYIDASGVYGSTEADAGSLRAFVGGKLRSTYINGHLDLLPTGSGFCRTSACFKAGDFRANMFPSLTSMHTLFLREHNRIVHKLQEINPYWDDERLYQEARKIVGAIMQHITFNEFLPIVLGRAYMQLNGLLLQSKGFYEGYNYYINPTITNSFTTAAFRFGHSLIQPQFKRYYPNHGELPWSPWLGDEYFNTSCLWKMGEVDELVLGLVNQHAQLTDPFFTEEITNRLYEPGALGGGQDLVAINTQRGRDNGIAPYMDWREYCGLKRVSSFEEMKEFMNEYSVMTFQRLYRGIPQLFAHYSRETAMHFNRASEELGMVCNVSDCEGADVLGGFKAFCNALGMYSKVLLPFIQPKIMDATSHRTILQQSVDDIDLFVGGISEIPVSGGIVGPTFACLIGKQFFKLRSGDRFWFENAPQNGNVLFTLDQLTELRKSSLARIICDNTQYIETIQPLVMLVASDWNPRRYCSDPAIASINLNKWKEDHSEPYFVSNNHISFNNHH